MPRKKPYSGKLKKKQLQEKRERHRAKTEHESRWKRLNSASSESEEEVNVRVNKLNLQPTKPPDRKNDPNRYRLQFFQETREEIQDNKKRAQLPFHMVSEEELEVDLTDIYQPGSVLDIPKRPLWDYKLSKEQLEQREEGYFKNYLDNIHSKYSPADLSYFELNLETWRQLWRVLEMSDIILLITDIRHPAVHFSPALYDHVTKDLGKPLILILNKIDLAPPALVVAWKHYLQEKFPMLQIVCFTSYPKDKSDIDMQRDDPGKVMHKKRKRGKSVAVGPLELWQACQTIVKDEVDLSGWKKKIEANISAVESDLVSIVHNEIADTSYQQHVRYKDGIVTIGCVGYPNVGKSSLLNGLVGKKVVSVSRTPGHTKHFQTIFLTPTVKLCDCPGLVFPSKVLKQLQILCGIYPIAQVREPYSPLMYLAQRINVVKLLKLQHPAVDHNRPYQGGWSAFDICDAWAQKRGFMTARTARPDLYRAANHLLRIAVDGRLCLCFRPPAYSKTKDYWEKHVETEALWLIQHQHCRRNRAISDESESLSSSDEEIGGEDGISMCQKPTSKTSDSATTTKEDDDQDSESENNLVSKNPFDLLDSD